MSPIPWLVPGPLHVLLALGVALLLLRQAPQRAARRWKPWLAAAMAASWLMATPGAGSLLVERLERRFPTVELSAIARDEAGVVVVLASGQMFRPDGRPDPELDADGWARLQAGIALWRRTGGRLMLVGGPGKGRLDSFAGLMRRLAEQAGVPAEAILEASGSRNTREDLRAAAEALQGHVGPRWLVTNALHMPRAMAVAERLHMHMRPYPCAPRHLRQPSWRAWLPDNGDPGLWRDGLHEWLGLAWYRWRDGAERQS